MKDIKYLFFVFILLFCFTPRNVFASNNISVNINGNDEYFETLEEAINNVPDNVTTTITLLDDVVVGNIVVINANKDVVIDGKSEFRIVRNFTDGVWYTGQLFDIKAGGKLALKGITIDNFNNYTFNYEQYEEDLLNKTKVTDVTTYLTSEVNAPNISAVMINNAGEFKLLDSTIKNYFSTSGKGLINAVNNSITTISNSTIKHCAITNGGLVVYVTGSSSRVYIEDGNLIDDNYVAGNGGIFKIYNGAILEMNGGTVSNTRSVNTNGTVSMTYGTGSTFIFNDGLVTNNSGVIGKNNGRNAPFYVHRGSKFIMNGGIIEDNYGLSTGGIDAPGYATSDVELNSGLIQGNQNGVGSEYRSDVNIAYDYDLVIGENMIINGNVYVKGDLVNNGKINGEVTLNLSESTDGNSLSGSGVIVGDVILNYSGEVPPVISPDINIEGQSVSYNGEKEVVLKLMYNADIGQDNKSYDLLAVATDTVPEIAVPSLKGHTFVDWYIDKELTTKWEENSITKNLVLYAKWEKNNYVVSWNTGDTTIDELYSYGDKIEVPDTPRKEGYVFLGWEGYEENMLVGDSNLEFKAIWEKFENPETFAAIPYVVIIIVVAMTLLVLFHQKKKIEEI